MRDNEEPRAEILRGLSSLADPARQRLYDAVSASDEPIGRDTAAKAAGISRTLAAYHLDLLVDAGLLGTEFARPEGVGGPGAGRPAKHYFRVQEERSVSVPPRDYELLADLLAAAYDDDGDGAVHRALLQAAGSEGRRAGARSAGARSATAANKHEGDGEVEGDEAAGEGTDNGSHEELCEVLRQRGYEPAVSDNGDIDMRNCPFHRLSRSHTDLVCGLNHALLSGVLEGHGDDSARAQLCPREGRCCVIIRSEEADDTTEVLG